MTGFLVACAPQMQPYQETATARAHLGSHLFHTADNTSLPYRSWLPEKKTRAVIVALHGFNDYSHAFEDTGEFFAQHGIAVYAYDQRGFGQAPDTGIWADERNLDADLKACVLALKKQYPGRPIYILGESMGGAVAISALSDPSFPKVQGVILSAPALWGADAMSPVYRGTLWLVAHTIPYHTFTGSDLHIQASNNIPMLRALAADPLVIKATRGDTIYGLVQLMGDAYEDVPHVKVPTLLLYGGRDQVIPHGPIEGALRRFTVPVRYVYYPDNYHMLLRDLQGDEVMDDILSWIDHPDAAVPSGFGKLVSPKKP